jgi:PAS domain S-box-containing protein
MAVTSISMSKEISMTKSPLAVRSVFAIMAAVVICAMAATHWAGLRVLRLRAFAASHRDVIVLAERLLSALKDVETGGRGFVITGNERYLEPYEKALPQLQRQINRLRELKNIAGPIPELDPIQELVRTRLEILSETIALRRTVGFEAAEARVQQGDGKETMDQLRGYISAVGHHQEASLQIRDSQIDSANTLRTLIFLLCGSINLFFIVWAERRIRLARNEREAALAEMQAGREEVARQKELLAVTLSSIGDCVIVTDAGRRITFMNVVAENLTGWKLKDAGGRLVGEVFRIINEDTNAAVENPVDKVLQHGVIVGLANHTLLIRKDGTEVPIDDSGAPIRQADGVICGVVLVFRDFSEHKAAERALRQAKETAETASAGKDHFLAMLSHELRTPLTPVLATLNLWEVSDELPFKMKSDVQMLRRSVELEARIIDDLLDVTRIAKGILSFTREAIDVHELIEFVVGLCHSEFQGTQLVLSVDLEAEKHYLHTDAGRLQQTLWNVMKNAAKFTETGGKIRIATSNDAGGNLVIIVTDNGIGMTPETLGQLFKPFEQGEKVISRRFGGLGLGMAISSAIVEQLGGELTAESDGLGKGSTFTIIFPSTDVGPIRNDRNVEWDQPLAGFKILLVEDHHDSALALTRLLSEQGYVVQTADTVASALEAVAETAFDILICDIGLPDGTGFQLIETVRMKSTIPAIAISGFGMEEDVAQSESSGFDVHLTKPVNFHNLQAAIRKLTPHSNLPSSPNLERARFAA